MIPSSGKYSSLWVLFYISIVAQSSVQASNSMLDVDLPEIAIMPKMHAQWATDHMVYNGMPMSIRNYRINRGPDKVLQYYENKWKTKNLASVGRVRNGEYETLGMMYGDHYYTIQSRKTNTGAEGSLVVTLNPEEIRTERSTEFPLAPGANIITKILSSDAGVIAETLTLTTRKSVSSNAAWYKSELGRKGWTNMSGNAKSVRAEDLLTFQKGIQTCQITFIKNAGKNLVAKNDLLPVDRTLILVNWVKGK